MKKRKKYDPGKAARALVNTYTKKICFIDGAALEEMQVFGTIPPHQSIVNAVSDHLKTRPQDWSFKVFCFCVDQFGEKYERVLKDDFNQITLPELYIENVRQNRRVHRKVQPSSLHQPGMDRCANTDSRFRRNV